MGDFRSYERGERDEGSRPPRRSFGGGGRSFGGDRGGRSFGGDRGGFGGGRGRSFGGSGGRDRRDMEPCDAVCAKCGKNCKVPFKPTGDRPVYCSECFTAGAGGDSSRGSSRGGASSGSGISAQQFQELNKKVDKIIEILSSLEIIPEEGEEELDDEEEEIADEPIVESAESKEKDAAEVIEEDEIVDDETEE